MRTDSAATIVPVIGAESGCLNLLERIRREEPDMAANIAGTEVVRDMQSGFMGLYL